MSFYFDKQTIDDLELFKTNGTSIFDLFNKVKTVGGREHLWKMIENPSNDSKLLERRVQVLAFLQSHEFHFDINNSQIDFIEHYLESNFSVLKNNLIDRSIQRIKNNFSRQEGYYIISLGVKYIIFTMKSILKLAHELGACELPEYLKLLTNDILAFGKVV